ncbi:putative major virion structural protein [Brevibacillus phage SecTim467]|uniref:Putative major virion structural protein n=2 Tax=Jenstvirus jenst TaxID=1982225 RepID=A0A0K2CNY7_9CAUD|nr:virion structural protein [Brevibacillus phage Jenst]ALA07173.1 putative major virion structural protein [Brevibacillus phage Jenst]ALA07542.1 putative major virion structural protein [Brevibacillus phage SecTim467]
MSWFDGDSTIQLFPQDLEKLFNSKGWNTFIKYRSVSEDAQKFADVRLFRSLGSDGQMRNFGMAYGYGKTTKPELGEQEFISQNSVLGALVKDETLNTKFRFKVYPVIKDSVIVYKNSNVVPDTEYELDELKGIVTFTSAPDATDIITANYSPSPIAPQPVKRLYFFTFDDVRGEKIVQGISGGVKVGDPESILPDGDGVRKAFPIPTESTIKADTVRIYINQVEQTETAFSVDYATNTITFVVAPDAGAEIHASYIRILNATGTQTLNYGDVRVKNFDPNKGDTLMNAVYSALYYIYPSLPTALSFTPLQDFDRGWQRDSTMYYWGNVTKDRIVMFFRPDPTPGAENTYFAPLYIGRLTTLGKSPRKNHVLIAGCREADEVVWKKDLKLGAIYVDYGNHTSNGNRSVQLQQSIGGTYYQQHYLAFITHDKEVDAGQSRFNPSVYTGKYHISPMYIVHPNDGFVGKLDECYAVHPKNISQLDELEVIETSENEDLGKGDGFNKIFHLAHQPSLKDDGTPFKLDIRVDCVLQTLGTDYNIDMETKTITFVDGKLPASGKEVIATYEYKQLYRYTLADTPVSPFTLANMSPFAPIGLGILKETLKKNS